MVWFYGSTVKMRALLMGKEKKACRREVYTNKEAE
jgi:hypothetical protein